MSKAFTHTGLCVGPITPMKSNEDIDLDSISAYAEHLHRSGVNAVFVNGTTAEGLSMTVGERKLVAEKWMEVGRKKFDKIIIHCGALCLRDAQELAMHAEKIGADAIAAVPSFYFAPKNIEELTIQIQTICNAAPNTPFIYYHSERTHVSFDMALFIENIRSRAPNFAGIKWATSDLAGALRCLTVHGNAITVMWANEDTLLAALAVGIRSFNGSTYSFTAKIAKEIIQAFDDGNLKLAQQKQLHLKQIVDLVEKNGTWLQRHKVVIEIYLGLRAGPARLPLTPLSDQDVRSLQMDLDKLSFAGAIRN